MPGIPDWKPPNDDDLARILQAVVDVSSGPYGSRPIEEALAETIPPVVATAGLQRRARQPKESARLYRTAVELCRYLIAWCETKESEQDEQDEQHERAPPSP